MSYLWLYLPVTLVVMTVLEACRSDDAKKIARNALRNFGMLTVVLIVGSIALYFVNRHA